MGNYLDGVIGLVRCRLHEDTNLLSVGTAPCRASTSLSAGGCSQFWLGGYVLFAFLLFGEGVQRLVRWDEHGDIFSNEDLPVGPLRTADLDGKSSSSYFKSENCRRYNTPREWQWQLNRTRKISVQLNEDRGIWRVTLANGTQNTREPITHETTMKYDTCAAKNTSLWYPQVKPFCVRFSTNCRQFSLEFIRL